MWYWHSSFSTRWGPRLIQIPISPWFHTPQRSHDDLQQRTCPRPRQTGRPRFSILAVAYPPCRPSNVWLGWPHSEIFSARKSTGLLGFNCLPPRLRLSNILVFGPLATWLWRVDPLRRGSDPLRWLLCCTGLVPTLSTLCSHGSCDIRPSLLPSALLRDSYHGFCCRLVHPTLGSNG